MGDSDSSTEEFGAPRERRGHEASQAIKPLAAPVKVTNTASLSTQLSPTDWLVPLGHLEAFLLFRRRSRLITNRCHRIVLTVCVSDRPPHSCKQRSAYKTVKHILLRNGLYLQALQEILYDGLIDAQSVVA
jgi:hypothetical protein